MNFKELNEELDLFMKENGIDSTINDTQELNEYKKWRRPKGYNKQDNNEPNDDPNKSPLDVLIDKEKEGEEESEVIEGEIVDELPDNLKSANSPEAKDAYEKQYALTQVYKGALEEISKNNETEEVSEKSKQEMVALLKEWLQTIDKQKSTDLATIPQEEQGEYQTFVTQAHKSVEKLKDEVEATENIDIKGKPRKGRKLSKIDLKKLMDDGFSIFKNLLSAQLPKSLLQAIAYTNPLTTLVYDNMDAVGATAKAAGSAAKTAIDTAKEGVKLAKNTVVAGTDITKTVGKGIVNATKSAVRGVKSASKYIKRIKNNG